MGKRILCALMLAAAAGCGDGDDKKSTNGTQETVVPTDELSVSQMLATALQGEYLAEATYVQVVADFGAIEPFTAIVTAEVRHSASLALLYEARGVAAPASEWSAGNVPRYSSVQEACAAGVVFETAAVARYGEYLSTGLPADVERVFTNLRNASRDNHLPAFEQCVKAESGRPVP